VRPYRDDDNEQYRRGWQRRWQDDMQTGARPRRSQGYAEDRYPGDRSSYGGERERERYGNPLERYNYDEPWRMPSPYRLRRSGWDDEGYRPAYDEELESSGLGNYRRSYGERDRSYGASSERGIGERGYGIASERSYGERESSYDRRRGPYRGRGPKGYRRSDEAIREDISQRLEEHGQIDASEIEVTVREGTVTLKGVVDERWTKRLAEDLAEDVNGVRDVENHLRVDQGFFERQQQTQASSKRGQESSRQV
jgi:hypothetical protein